VADRRVLTLTAATVTVVANMIGTGAFTTTGFMAQNGAGGGDILLAWMLGGLIALCGALCYGEVGANLPHSGGEYYYLSRLIHPSLGFMSGAVSVIVGFAGPIAAAAMLMNSYVATVIPGWPVRAMAAALIMGLALLHSRDVHIGSRFQTIITVAKVLLIIAFIGAVFIAFPKGDHSDMLRLNSGFLVSSPFAVVLVLVAFAYAGWNAAAYIGTELKDPQRTLPRSLLLGTTIVTILYFLLNLSYLLAVPAQKLSGIEEVGYTVATALWGSSTGGVVSMLIALTLLCPISSMLMVGPRIAEAMARDGFLPTWLSQLNHRNVPARSIWLQGGIATLIAVTLDFNTLLIYIGFTLNIFAALTVLSLFRLRGEGKARIKICIGYPLPPLIFLAFTIWMTVWSIQSAPAAALYGFLTLASGYVLYLFRAKQARLAVDVVD